MVDLIGPSRLRKAMATLHKDARIFVNDVMKCYTIQANSRYKRPPQYSLFLRK